MITVKVPKVTTVDFETFGIEGRPEYPPKPVGVSIKPWGKPSRYYSWGHASDNNCTYVQGLAALEKVYDGKDPILFHHGKFDADVAEVHMGLPIPPWERVHDTTFLLFLDDPNQRKVGLKDAAARLLNMPPDERDVVAEWLVRNQPVAGIRISLAPGSKHTAGKYIAYAPGSIVGPYACGDTDRTVGLFEVLYPSIVSRGMLEAYDRERKLCWILLAMERQGVPVDLPRLRKDVAFYRQIMEKADWMLRVWLGVTDNDFNIGSGDQFVAALDAAGMLDRTKATLTKTGKISTAKGTLEGVVSDPRVSALYRYRSALQTCLATFMEPWLAVAERTGGIIYTNWNQIKGEAGGGGTRTGRLSSSPNFQNIPNEFPELFKLIKDAYLQSLPPLPMCRGYIIPFAKDHVLYGRDFSQQEVRILGHFEDGPLMEQYQADPWTDMHDFARAHMEKTFRRKFERKPVKNVGLGLIYGQGVPSLAERNGWSVPETQQVSDAILNLYPGLKTLRKDMKLRARSNQPLRTWGGRLCLCEPPMIINGRTRTFDYKMVNTLIQGSAADDTKEAMIRVVTAMIGAEAFKTRITDAMLKHKWRLLLQVHDELLFSVPKKDLPTAHDIIRTEMESVEFDIPILTEGEWSEKDWASMTDFDKKGVVIYKEHRKKVLA